MRILLQRVSQASVTIDDRLAGSIGRGFVLLRLGDKPPPAANIVRAAEAHGVPLTAIDIAEPEVLTDYERRLVLVRPDGHVAWRADEAPADAGALIDVIRGQQAELKQQKLGRTT